MLNLGFKIQNTHLNFICKQTWKTPWGINFKCVFNSPRTFLVHPTCGSLETFWVNMFLLKQEFPGHKIISWKFSEIFILFVYSFVLNFKFWKNTKNFMTFWYFHPVWKCHALDIHQNLLQILGNDTHMSTIVSILNINYKPTVSNTSGRPWGEEARKWSSGVFPTLSTCKEFNHK